MYQISANMMSQYLHDRIAFFIVDMGTKTSKCCILFFHWNRLSIYMTPSSVPPIRFYLVTYIKAKSIVGKYCSKTLSRFFPSRFYIIRSGLLSLLLTISCIVSLMAMNINTTATKYIFASVTAVLVSKHCHIFISFKKHKTISNINTTATKDIFALTMTVLVNKWRLLFQ